MLLSERVRVQCRWAVESACVPEARVQKKEDRALVGRRLALSYFSLVWPLSRNKFISSGNTHTHPHTRVLRVGKPKEDKAGS